MRWPVQIQLLLPVLSVVILAIVLASAATAWLGVWQARRQQEENLKRVVTTLTSAPYPPTESVLRQMSGLSGAEFVFLDATGQVRASTLRLSADELLALDVMVTSDDLERFSENPRVTIAGKIYLGHRTPVAKRQAAVLPGSLVVLYYEDRWWAAIRRAGYPALLSGAVAAAAAMLVTALLAQRFVRPIQRLGDQTARIAAGDFHPVEVFARDDEIRDLAVSINRMVEKLSRYEVEVRRNEQLRTLGRLGAGMAHQLRNSATGARMAIELHQRECTTGAAGADGDSLEVALRQLRLMESYLQRFLTLGRSRPVPHERVALETVVEEVLELVRPNCTHAKIELSVRRPAEPIEVLGEAESLRQVLVNLILNAVEAAARQSDGPPRVIVELQKQDNARAVLCVKDSGPGPAEGVREQLFQPFVSEKPEGAGLGLFVSRRIAEAHGGSIAWHRSDNMTCFTVEIPLIQSG